MEPVTHILAGAVLARASGINRRAAYATIAMMVAAEFPDIDTLWSLAGPLTGFAHHRGITHTFAALPIEAALIAAGFCLIRKRPAKAPFNLAWLYAGTLLALLSHLLLDWTNNYGLRPFFPFNPRWYAGSFVFIFEPVLFAMLLLALILPPLFALINSEIGTRREPFRGRPAAIAACLGILALYALRYTQHARAITQGTRLAASSSAGEPTRIFASPEPANPFLWHLVAEYPDHDQLSTLNTRTGLPAPTIPADTLYKVPTTLPLLVAKRSTLGRYYLDWSMYPILTEQPYQTDSRTPLTQITFTDARFLYDVSYFRFAGREHPPLSGTVTLDMAQPEGHRVQETTFNGKPQP